MLLGNTSAAELTQTVGRNHAVSRPCAVKLQHPRKAVARPTDAGMKDKSLLCLFWTERRWWMFSGFWLLATARLCNINRFRS